MNLNILNGKEVKKIKIAILEQWDCTFTTDAAFVQTTKERILLISHDLEKIDLTAIRIDSIGMYFCEIKNDEYRLSIEGSQLIGPSAKKNVVEMTKEEMRSWLKGNNLQKETDCKGFVIMKYQNDYLGCGKVRKNEIINFVPKTRRIMSQD